MLTEKGLLPRAVDPDEEAVDVTNVGVSLDVALALRACEGMDDWYVIERAEHDGRMWLEPHEYGAALMTSARLGDADVEGPAADMRAIATAIETRAMFHGTRCRVVVDVAAQRAMFDSPRNSSRAAWVPLARADVLAAEIRVRLAHGPVLT